jgi:hypothetical protein
MHTSKKQRQRSQRPILRLKPLQKGRQSQDIHQRMEEPDMHQRKRICPIH